jgi:hypothetical protein
MNAEPPEQVIGVHLGHPLTQILPDFFPAGNYAGAVLLCRVLELALLRDGLMQEGSCGILAAELNDCIFLALVSNATAAADTIMPELKAAGLLPFCQIGILEETSWRCVHPSSEVRLNWLMDGERIELAKQIQADRLNLLLNIMKLLPPEKGEQGKAQ